MHYLDNAATTQVDAAVVDVITRTLQAHFANASALYGPAAESEALLEDCRAVLATALGAAPGEVVFTASGSEGNNIALWGAAFARRAWGRSIVTTGYEHASLRSPCAQLGALGYTVRTVPPDRDGRVMPAALADAVTADTALVAAMQVNNETGAVLDVAETVRLVKQKNPRTAVHIDAVQGFMKLPLDVRRAGVDSCAVAAHKLHGPKGVGALYLRRGYHIEPPYTGGKQEGGLRPGTENLAYIAGFAKAVETARPTLAARLQKVQALGTRLRREVAAREYLVLNSPAAEYCSPYILNFSIPGLRSETVLHFLELSWDVLVSSASACGKGAASHTLQAMGLPASRIDSALRVSFCGASEDADLDALLMGLDAANQKLARARRR